MIQDRIQKSERGFFLLAEQDTEKTPYFGIYTMKDEPECMPELTEMRYWDPAESYEIPLKAPGCFIYICEQVNGEVVEEHRFYWSPREAKPRLEISVAPGNSGIGKGYGKGSYVITVSWPDNGGDMINNEYIFLRSNSGDKFQFRRKYIMPAEGAKRPEAKFIYIVPETDNPDNYSVDVLPQLREKYNVVM